MSEARQHHWIPQVYLKGFTRDWNKRSRLFVLDLVKREEFWSKPRGVGGARDFNRVDAPDVSPDAMEQGIGKFESVFGTCFPK
jgi:hypothetical protein